MRLSSPRMNSRGVVLDKVWHHAALLSGGGVKEHAGLFPRLKDNSVVGFTACCHRRFVRLL